MTEICIACGMPMESAEDHALSDLARPYCPHCATDTGEMQTYPQKLANFARWLVTTQGLDGAVAHAQAVAILGRLPAWRDVASRAAGHG